MKQATDHLSVQCPIMKGFIKTFDPPKYIESTDYFAILSRTIIGQQLSVKAAATIRGRFEAGVGTLSPKRILEIDQESMRTFGVSRQKFGYLQSLAQHFVDDTEVFDDLENLEDQAVIEALTKVKGIGVWTAQMFMMFTLKRPDILPLDDVGIQNSLKRFYSIEGKKAMVSEMEKFRPYRSIACHYLWRGLDNLPVKA